MRKGDGPLGIPSFNHSAESASCCEGAGHFYPDGSTGSGDIVENSVHRVFVKDPDVPVGVDIHFERLEFEARFVRHVVDGNGAEIRQSCFGTDGGVFWNFDRNLVTLIILVGKGLDIGEWSGDSALRVPFAVPKSFLFTTHALSPGFLQLFHPVCLTDLLQFDE
jgi:hypothetical protein